MKGIQRLPFLFKILFLEGKSERVILIKIYNQHTVKGKVIFLGV